MSQPQSLGADCTNANDGDIFVYRAATPTQCAKLLPRPTPGSRKITASTTVLQSDGYIFADATAGPIIITLRPATVKERVGIKKTDSTNNTVTVVHVGGDSVDGQPSKVLSLQYESYMFAPDGVSMWGIF